MKDQINFGIRKPTIQKLLQCCFISFLYLWQILNYQIFTIMKKFTILIVILLSAGFVFGQFSIGPKIGFNTSELTTNLDQISTDMQSSFNFGAFARFGKKFYLQPEVNYLTSGGVFKKPAIDDVNPINQTVEMKSIEIPVIVGWRIINFGIGNIRILAGPSASIVTNTTVSTSDPDNFLNPIEEADVSDLNWGFNMGAGVDVLMFTLDVRYQMGLNEVIQKVDEFDFYSKNNLFAVSLGWKIL
jgi:hypothetical protein